MATTTTSRKKCNQHQPKWTTENLKLALQAVGDGMAKRKAAEAFNIPWSTFCDKLSGRRKIAETTNTVLTEQEEEEILQWLKETTNRGFSRTKEDFLMTVKKYLDHKGKVTPWVNNLPGRTWFQLFRKRHADITFRKPQKLGTPRALVSREKIMAWFERFTDSIKDVDPTILLEPCRIYNADESGFHLDEASGKVLAFSGSKHVFQIGNEDKTMITVLVCCNAADHFINPMLIYPGTKFRGFRPQDVFEESFVTKTKRGWIDGDTFADWLEHVFIPQTEQAKKPILLLVDGHRSHQTLRASNLCQKNEIILYCLPPHSSHILQPLDVGIFSSMKKAWKDAVRREAQTADMVTKKNFAIVFKHAYESTTAKGLTRQAFRKSGIYPCDPLNIEWAKVMDFPVMSVSECQTIQSPPEARCTNTDNPHPQEANSSEKDTPQRLPMMSLPTQTSTDSLTPVSSRPCSSEDASGTGGTSQSNRLRKLIMLTAQVGEDKLRIYFDRYEKQEASDDQIYHLWSSYYHELMLQTNAAPDQAPLENLTTPSQTTSSNNPLELPILRRNTGAKKRKRLFPSLISGSKFREVLTEQIDDKQKEDERKLQRKAEMEERKKVREQKKEDMQKRKEERKKQQEERKKQLMERKKQRDEEIARKRLERRKAEEEKKKKASGKQKGKRRRSETDDETSVDEDMMVLEDDNDCALDEVMDDMMGENGDDEDEQLGLVETTCSGIENGRSHNIDRRSGQEYDKEANGYDLVFLDECTGLTIGLGEMHRDEDMHGRQDEESMETKEEQFTHQKIPEYQRDLQMELGVTQEHINETGDRPLQTVTDGKDGQLDEESVGDLNLNRMNGSEHEREEETFNFNINSSSQDLWSDLIAQNSAEIQELSVKLRNELEKGESL